MSWQLIVFSGRKLGQYADQELLKSLFKSKTPNLVLKKKNGKKRTQKQENSVAGSRTWYICSCKKLLYHYTTVTHMMWKINVIIIKLFFYAIALFKAGGAVFIINSNIHLRKINLSVCFKAISHYFWFKGPIDVDNRSNYLSAFGGELGDQLRRTLERIDMKLGRFNKQNSRWNINMCVLRMKPPILETRPCPF